MMDNEKEIKFLITRLNFFKRNIIKIEKDLRKEDLVISTNAGKTECANPKIKILNDYIKNMMSIYDKLIKLSSGEGGEDIDDILGFIQRGNKER